MTAPSVSVVIPVYRAEAHIANCIDALAAQTVRPAEILLVDDHGGDDSMTIGESAAHNEGLIEIDEPAYDRDVVSGEFARDLLTDRYCGWPGNKPYVRSELPLPFFDEGRAYEDFLPTLRSALNSKRVALANEPYYRYTRTPSSMSAQFGSYTTDQFPIAEDVGDLLDAAGRLPGWDRELAGLYSRLVKRHVS